MIQHLARDEPRSATVTMREQVLVPVDLLNHDTLPPIRRDEVAVAEVRAGSTALGLRQRQFVIADGLRDHHAALAGIDHAKLRLVLDEAVARFSGEVQPLGGAHNAAVGQLVEPGTRTLDAIHDLMSYPMFARQFAHMLTEPGFTFRGLVAEGGPLADTSGTLTVKIELANPHVRGYANASLLAADYGYHERGHNQTGTYGLTVSGNGTTRERSGDLAASLPPNSLRQQALSEPVNLATGRSLGDSGSAALRTMTVDARERKTQMLRVDADAIVNVTLEARNTRGDLIDLPGGATTVAFQASRAVEVLLSPEAALEKGLVHPQGLPLMSEGGGLFVAARGAHGVPDHTVEELRVALAGAGHPKAFMVFVRIDHLGRFVVGDRTLTAEEFHRTVLAPQQAAIGGRTLVLVADRGDATGPSRDVFAGPAATLVRLGHTSVLATDGVLRTSPDGEFHANSEGVRGQDTADWRDTTDWRLLRPGRGPEEGELSRQYLTSTLSGSLRTIAGETDPGGLPVLRPVDRPRPQSTVQLPTGWEPTGDRTPSESPSPTGSRPQSPSPVRTPTSTRPPSVAGQPVRPGRPVLVTRSREGSVSGAAEKPKSVRWSTQQPMTPGDIAAAIYGIKPLFPELGPTAHDFAVEPSRPATPELRPPGWGPGLRLEAGPPSPTEGVGGVPGVRPESRSPSPTEGVGGVPGVRPESRSPSPTEDVGRVPASPQEAGQPAPSGTRSPSVAGPPPTRPRRPSLRSQEGAVSGAAPARIRSVRFSELEMTREASASAADTAGATQGARPSGPRFYFPEDTPPGSGRGSPDESMSSSLTSEHLGGAPGVRPEVEQQAPPERLRVDTGVRPESAPSSATERLRAVLESPHEAEPSSSIEPLRVDTGVRSESAPSSSTEPLHTVLESPHETEPPALTARGDEPSPTRPAEAPTGPSDAKGKGKAPAPAAEGEQVAAREGFVAREEAASREELAAREEFVTSQRAAIAARDALDEARRTLEAGRSGPSDAPDPRTAVQQAESDLADARARHERAEVEMLRLGLPTDIGDAPRPGGIGMREPSPARPSDVPPGHASTTPRPPVEPGRVAVLTRHFERLDRAGRGLASSSAAPPPLERRPAGGVVLERRPAGGVVLERRPAGGVGEPPPGHVRVSEGVDVRTFDRFVEQSDSAWAVRDRGDELAWAQQVAVPDGWRAVGVHLDPVSGGVLVDGRVLSHDQSVELLRPLAQRLYREGRSLALVACGGDWLARDLSVLVPGLRVASFNDFAVQLRDGRVVAGDSTGRVRLPDVVPWWQADPRREHVPGVRVWHIGHLQPEMSGRVLRDALASRPTDPAAEEVSAEEAAKAYVWTDASGGSDRLVPSQYSWRPASRRQHRPDDLGGSKDGGGPDDPKGPGAPGGAGARDESGGLSRRPTSVVDPITTGHPGGPDASPRQQATTPDSGAAGADPSQRGLTKLSGVESESEFTGLPGFETKLTDTTAVTPERAVAQTGAGAHGTDTRPAAEPATAMTGAQRIEEPRGLALEPTATDSRTTTDPLAEQLSSGKAGSPVSAELPVRTETTDIPAADPAVGASWDAVWGPDRGREDLPSSWGGAEPVVRVGSDGRVSFATTGLERNWDELPLESGWRAAVVAQAREELLRLGHRPEVVLEPVTDLARLGEAAGRAPVQQATHVIAAWLHHAAVTSDDSRVNMVRDGDALTPAGKDLARRLAADLARHLPAPEPGLLGGSSRRDERDRPEPVAGSSAHEPAEPDTTVAEVSATVQTPSTLSEARTQRGSIDDPGMPSSHSGHESGAEAVTAGSDPTRQPPAPRVELPIDRRESAPPSPGDLSVHLAGRNLRRVAIDEGGDSFLNAVRETRPEIFEGRGPDFMRAELAQALRFDLGLPEGFRRLWPILDARAIDAVSEDIHRDDPTAAWNSIRQEVAANWSDDARAELADRLAQPRMGDVAAEQVAPFAAAFVWRLRISRLDDRGGVSHFGPADGTRTVLIREAREDGAEHWSGTALEHRTAETPSPALLEVPVLFELQVPRTHPALEPLSMDLLRVSESRRASPATPGDSSQRGEPGRPELLAEGSAHELAPFGVPRPELSVETPSTPSEAPTPRGSGDDPGMLFSHSGHESGAEPVAAGHEPTRQPPALREQPPIGRLGSAPPIRGGLPARLADWNLRRVMIPGNGDCFFNAVRETHPEIFESRYAHLMREELAQSTHADLMRAELAQALRLELGFPEEFRELWPRLDVPAIDAVSEDLHREFPTLARDDIREDVAANWSDRARLELADRIAEPGVWYEAAGDVAPLAAAFVWRLRISRLDDHGGVYELGPADGTPTVLIREARVDGAEHWSGTALEHHTAEAPRPAYLEVSAPVEGPLPRTHSTLEPLSTDLQRFTRSRGSVPATPGSERGAGSRRSAAGRDRSASKTSGGLKPSPISPSSGSGRIPGPADVSDEVVARATSLVRGRLSGIRDDALTAAAGRDVFAARRPLPVPRFLATGEGARRVVYNFDDVSASRRADLFAKLDMRRPGAPTWAELQPRQLRSSPRVSTNTNYSVTLRRGLVAREYSIPHLLHHIWLGSPLSEDHGTRTNFRAGVEHARRHNPGFDTLLWTDVPRTEIRQARVALVHGSVAQGRQADVADMLRWAQGADVRLVNMHEFLSVEDSPLTPWLQGELARRLGTGFAAASDALRVMILHRFGGVYVDGDNTVWNLERTVHDVVRGPDGFAMLEDQHGNLSNDAIMSAAGTRATAVYLEALESRFSKPIWQLYAESAVAQYRIGGAVELDDATRSQWSAMVNVDQEIVLRTGQAHYDVAPQLGYTYREDRSGIRMTPAAQLARIPNTVISDAGHAMSWTHAPTALHADEHVVADRIESAVVNLHRDLATRSGHVYLPTVARIISTLQPPQARAALFAAALDIFRESLQPTDRIEAFVGGRQYNADGIMSLIPGAEDIVRQRFPQVPYLRWNHLLGRFWPAED
jgi:phage terminase Nu1 subunit (DNA packaging protein)